MNSAAEKCVVLADDHPAFLAGVRQYFEARPDFTEIFDANNGRSCFDLIARHAPEWAVIDLGMPEKTGFEVLEELLTTGSLTQVVVLSMHAELAYAERAKDLGANAFIAKEDALSELDAALSTSADDFYVSKSVGQVVPNFLNEKPEKKLEQLTPTEGRVLELLAQGLTSRDIAGHLEVSIRTVQAHRRNMTDKLDLRGPNRLMEFAVRNVQKV